jgi:Asp-tRNA(Asn)/Glu-tRNA(Gln) amidotransferase A subunit family amidase
MGVHMTNSADLSRRAFLGGTSATLALGLAPAALRAADAQSGDGSLLELSAVEALARIARGELSAENYARALLERCRAGHGLNAFISLEPDRVLEEARRRDHERRAGVRPGALFGLPIPLKDCVNTRDYPTTGGTPGLRHFRPADDAPLVKVLRGAGAIVLGKTNMHELGYGWTSNNETFGPVRNPYDPSRIPGGSSGGTGAAIASRMAPLGVGEDTNGSIRIPAALCGVAGLRPTTGRYPTRGCVPLSPVFDQVGPLARTVADLALFDAVMTNDWRPLQPTPLRGLRLGVVRDYWYRDLDPELERITSAALARLQEAGVELVESQFPQLAQLHESITTPVITHDVGPAIGRYLSEYRAGLNFEQLVGQASPGVRADLRQVFPGGSDFVSDGAYQVLVNEKLPQFRRLYGEYFSRTGVAAIVFPATAVPALPIGAEGDVTIGARRVSLFNALARNITPAGSATTPGLVLPAGLTSSGLPVAIELDGPPGTDRALLALGMSVAQVLGPVPPPSV